jgi:TPR repeat protein
MARLTSRQRKNLPRSAFAVPGRRAYPINDRSHARNALARVSQHGSPRQKAMVRSAVRRRYPGIKQQRRG